MESIIFSSLPLTHNPNSYLQSYLQKGFIKWKQNTPWSLIPYKKSTSIPPLSSLFAPEHLKRLTLAALPKPNCITAWNSRTWQIQPAKEVLLQRSRTFLVMKQCLFRTWSGIFPLIKTFNNGMHDQTSWGKNRYRIYITINDCRQMFWINGLWTVPFFSGYLLFSKWCEKAVCSY